MTSNNDIFIISEQTALIYAWVIHGALLHAVNMFGIVTNIVNIICFAKQGFEDSSNISLLGLSVSDLGSLTTMVWTSICLTPAVVKADLPFDPPSVMYVTSGMTHFAFTRVSGCITAMIALERCLCITAPLKIKQLITPKRTVVITVGIFITFFCCLAPFYTVNRLGFTFSVFRNKTLLSLVSTNDRQHVELIFFIVSNFSIPVGSFVIIVVCTVVLSVKLRGSSKWRTAASNNTQGDKVSSRNQKTAKMVVMISILFIVCFIPVSIVMLSVGFVQELSLNGKYFNISLIIGGLGYVLESINSSTNIFIYYHMSSKFRDTFNELLVAKIRGSCLCRCIKN